MDLNDRISCYRALQTRDSRFDGRLFVGVTSTGIYCRPICPARTARIENCRFYPSAAAAQAQGFRPCLRCRPESAPGGGAWRGASATVTLALDLLSAGGEDEANVGAIALRLGLSDRQLRRLFQQHLGASPVSVLQTRRILFAKRLIHETRLPMTQVAMAAGFGSVRRFNETFKAMYRRAPSALRKDSSAPAAEAGAGAEAKAEAVLRLRYHPPYDWDAMLSACVPIPGVAVVAGGEYRRTARFRQAAGTVRVRHDGARHNLHVGLRLDDVRAYPEALDHVGRRFDTAADIDRINAHLCADPLLAPLVKARPGLRPRGVWDGFEAAVLAILPIPARDALLDLCAAELPPALRQDGLTRLFPDASAVAGASLDALPLPAARTRLLRSIACAARDDATLFGLHADMEQARLRWCALPGIDDATARLLAACSAADSDSFALADPVLSMRSLSWQPWRAYAARHLERLVHEENP